ncbi:MAG: lipoyl(octanoyl) transferase LipB [Candidatus Latescibacterota bacterium]
MNTEPTQPCLVRTLGMTDYDEAWDLQKDLQRKRIAGKIPDTLLFVEHPPIYTLGKGGKLGHLLLGERALKRKGIAFRHVDRGGDITFHGPGQLVGYFIVDLKALYLDLHRFFRDIEEILIRTLGDFGLSAARKEGVTGVCVGSDKVAAIGFEVRRWVTMHGFALNVHTDLSYFEGIVPCGLSDTGVTSIGKLLGRRIELDEVRTRVMAHVETVLDRRGVREGELLSPS